MCISDGRTSTSSASLKGASLTCPPICVQPLPSPIVAVRVLSPEKRVAASIGFASGALARTNERSPVSRKTSPSPTATGSACASRQSQQLPLTSAKNLIFFGCGKRIAHVPPAEKACHDGLGAEQPKDIRKWIALDF